jgi:hypothetical protein
MRHEEHFWCLHCIALFSGQNGVFEFASVLVAWVRVCLFGKSV